LEHGFSVSRKGVINPHTVSQDAPAAAHVVIVQPTSVPKIMFIEMPGNPISFLETKQATGGRNVDLPDGLNCYLYLPRGCAEGLPRELAPYLYFLKDKYINEQGSPKLSATDAIRALSDMERPLRV